MLKRLSARDRLLILADQFEPELRAAFIKSLDDIRSNVDLAIVIERLDRGDIGGALEAMHIDPQAFRAFEKAIYETYEGGGNSAVAGMPNLSDPAGGKFVLRFAIRNPRAEQWLAERSSTLITNLVADARSAVREVLTVGLSEGRNPRAVALEVVGRINRATGLRDGGILGLSQAQTKFVATARSELQSGDPAQMRNYLTRKLRDRRFDGAVKSAIEAGKPMGPTQTEKMVGSYSNRMRKYRGDVVAQNEMMAALNHSQAEAYRQAIESGAVAADQVEKIWNTAQDKRVRDSHAHIEGERVGINSLFSNALMFPHETGAPASEVIGCRCWCSFKINHLFGLK